MMGRHERAAAAWEADGALQTATAKWLDALVNAGVPRVTTTASAGKVAPICAYCRTASGRERSGRCRCCGGPEV